MIWLIIITIVAEILIFCIGLYCFALLNDRREDLFNLNTSTEYIDREMDRVVYKTFWSIILCLVTSIIIAILVI